MFMVASVGKENYWLQLQVALVDVGTLAEETLRKRYEANVARISYSMQSGDFRRIGTGSTIGCVVGRGFGKNPTADTVGFGSSLLAELG
jgi:hypothetical protein